MLVVDNLMVFYENALAVNELSMEIGQGQVVGVIGSNSAGKTTLLNTLSGLILDMALKERRKGGERITVMGKITFEGREITDQPAYRRARQGIEQALELFPALAALGRRKAGLMSGGEQQMLAIGMALMVGPKVLLLDEPLLGLSPAMQQKVVEAVKRVIAQTKTTIVIAEQFARPILPMIEMGYVIENGMLTMKGAGKELMDNPEIKSAYFGI